MTMKRKSSFVMGGTKRSNGNDSDSSTIGPTKEEFRIQRLDHARRLRRMYLLVEKKYLVNLLSERYFGKKQMWLIFIPIQLLAVWATVSTPLFNTIKFAQTGSIMGQDNLNFNATESDGEQKDLDFIETRLELLRTLTDTAIGAILLIITNLSKALNYERRAEQHKLVSDEMKSVMEDIDLHLKTIPNEDFDKDQADEIFLFIEDKFEKGAELSRKLTPPDEVAMAFENLEDDIHFLMIRREDTKVGKEGFYVRKIKTGIYEVDEDTYQTMFKDGYTDLADIISGNLATIRFMCLPSSSKTRDRTIEGLTEKLNRMSGAMAKKNVPLNQNLKKDQANTKVGRNESVDQFPTSLEEERDVTAVSSGEEEDLTLRVKNTKNTTEMV